VKFCVSQHKSQTKDSQATIDKDTEKQVETLKTDVEKNRSAVIDKILERVIQNDPQLHQNLTKVEA
jgi:V-type H+-transporting ATPase subunit G